MPDLPAKATLRLRNRAGKDDGHCRWCETHAQEYIAEERKKWED
eukprot:COSAG02_NODE_8921_length_2400_cov_1.271186_1_plen_43_part_10